MKTGARYIHKATIMRLRLLYATRRTAVPSLMILSGGAVQAPAACFCHAQGEDTMRSSWRSHCTWLSPSCQAQRLEPPQRRLHQGCTSWWLSAAPLWPPGGQGHTSAAVAAPGGGLPHCPAPWTPAAADAAPPAQWGRQAGSETGAVTIIRRQAHATTQMRKGCMAYALAEG